MHVEELTMVETSDFKIGTSPNVIAGKLEHRAESLLSKLLETEKSWHLG